MAHEDAHGTTARVLRVYVSAHCPACGIARERFAQVRAQRPAIPAQLIDVDAPEALVPAPVIGTPVYTWGDRVLFRGNPSARELLEQVTLLYEDDAPAP